MDAKIIREMGNMGLREIKWMTKPKIMVCAPSNSATDDILLKLVKNGFLSLNLAKYNPKMVWIGYNFTHMLLKRLALMPKLNHMFVKAIKKCSMRLWNWRMV